MPGVKNILKNRSIFIKILFFIFMVISQAINAQPDKKFIRQGNREYDKKKYSESEISY